MANQAFALSPISARASLPSEEDYDAIREAFMETARGRWFLDEYARRNRNADTSMVLDAVSRIEETLGGAAPARRLPPRTSGRRLLAAIGAPSTKPSRHVAAALDGLGLEESLAPIRKGARIIKEISWRWREIGADGRICDLLDSQVGAIESGCETIAAADPRVAIREAFDTIKASISAFSDIAGAAAVEDGVVVTSTPEAAVDVEAPVAMADADEADAYDEAMLDRVAMEMSAPDLDDADAEFAAAAPEADIADPPQAEVAEPPPVQVTEPQRDELVEAGPAPEQAIVEEVALPSPPVAPEPAPSLGATILANGLVMRPKTPANDPLAPIRRMSQAEKIAFFS